MSRTSYRASKLDKSEANRLCYETDVVRNVYFHLCGGRWTETECRCGLSSHSPAVTQPYNAAARTDVRGLFAASRENRGREMDGEDRGMGGRKGEGEGGVMESGRKSSKNEGRWWWMCSCLQLAGCANMWELRLRVVFEADWPNSVTLHCNIMQNLYDVFYVPEDERNTLFPFWA